MLFDSFQSLLLSSVAAFGWHISESFPLYNEKNKRTLKNPPHARIPTNERWIKSERVQINSTEKQTNHSKLDERTCSALKSKLSVFRTKTIFLAKNKTPFRQNDAKTSWEDGRTPCLPRFVQWIYYYNKLRINYKRVYTRNCDAYNCP